MKTKRPKALKHGDLEELVQDMSDIQPITPSLRHQWEAVRRTCSKSCLGRPREDPKLSSRIELTSIGPAPLAEAD